MTNTNEKFQVYGMGNALVDFEYLVADDFLKQHRLTKSSMTLIDEDLKNKLFQELKNLKKKKGGGSAANTLIALSQLGAKVCYSCKVKDDTDGHFYLKDLVDQGVVHHVNFEKSNRFATGTCIVLVTPDAERTMCTYLGITSDYGIDQIDWNYLKNSNYLYVEGYLFCAEQGTNAAFEAKAFAQKNNIKVALTCSDAGVIQGFKERFVQYLSTPIDLLFCNEAEALALSGEHDVYKGLEVLKKFAHHLVITRSSKGVLIWDGLKQVEVPGRNVKTIDVNGAGDMFAGAYIYGITHKFSSEQSAQLACHCASEVIQVYGPRIEKNLMQTILSNYKK